MPDTQRDSDDIAAEALMTVCWTGGRKPPWRELYERDRQRWRDFERDRQRLVRELTEADGG